jgi:uncharacterized protein (DUF1697 family)
MALVVLLKGINVGGHRTFRPTVLAHALKRFDVVNVGAAGTFVVRGQVSQDELRTTIMRRLPFEAELMICSGADIVRLAAGEPFAGQPSGPSIIHFVSVLAKRRPTLSPLPMSFPAEGEWLLKIIGHENRFVFGVHRRQMKAIGYLDRLEKVFGVPITTRGWNTMLAIARILQS